MECACICDLEQGQIHCFGCALGEGERRADDVPNLVVDVRRDGRLRSLCCLSLTLTHLGVTFCADIGDVLSNADDADDRAVCISARRRIEQNLGSARTRSLSDN